MDRKHGNAFRLACLFADRAYVIANNAGDASRVDECRLRLVCIDQLAKRRIQLFLAAANHVHFLQIGGEAQAMQLRAGRTCAADVPGVGSASDGPVDNVQSVRDGIEHDPRAAKNARPLADRARHALFFAVDQEGLFTLSIYLTLALLQKVRHPALHIPSPTSQVRTSLPAHRGPGDP